jgi:hypothetical protein
MTFLKPCPRGIYTNVHIQFLSVPFLAIRPTYGKSKAIPLQAWTGSEGSSRLRLPDFKTIGT